MHGGASLRGEQSGTFKHGLYSKYYLPEDVAGFEQWHGRASTEQDGLSLEDEWTLYKIEERLSQKSSLATEYKSDVEVRAELLDKVIGIRLKAQRLRGGEKATEVNVNLNAREDLVSRLTGLATRRRATGATESAE